MDKFILILILLVFTSFTMIERNSSTCGELCKDKELRLYHDIDKNTIKKKKRKKTSIVV